MELGIKARDRVTGFEGITVGVCDYISGCRQILIVPPVDKDGKLPESQWFDAQRLERVGEGRIVLDNAATPGPDRPAPKR